MTPADFELLQEQAEDAYRTKAIDAIEFLRRMHLLGFSPESCENFLFELDNQNAT